MIFRFFILSAVIYSCRFQSFCTGPYCHYTAHNGIFMYLRKFLFIRIVQNQHFSFIHVYCVCSVIFPALNERCCSYHDYWVSLSRIPIKLKLFCIILLSKFLVKSRDSFILHLFLFQVMKHGYPSKSDSESCQYSLLDFDSDEEYSHFFYKVWIQLVSQEVFWYRFMPKSFE